MNDRIVYKVLTAQEFAALQAGVFQGSAADLADGYIHFSTHAQLAATIERHFAGKSDLIIAAVSVSGFGDAMRWENSRGGHLFPHLYGIFSSKDVLAHCPLEWQSNGAVRPPIPLQPAT